MSFTLLHKTSPTSEPRVWNFQGFQWENTAHYTRSQDKHNFDFLAGTSYRANDFRQVGGPARRSRWTTSSIQTQYLDAGQDTLDNTWGGANVHYALSVRSDVSVQL